MDKLGTQVLLFVELVVSKLCYFVLKFMLRHKALNFML